MYPKPVGEEQLVVAEHMKLGKLIWNFEIKSKWSPHPSWCFCIPGSSCEWLRGVANTQRQGTYAVCLPNITSQRSHDQRFFVYLYLPALTSLFQITSVVAVILFLWITSLQQHCCWTAVLCCSAIHVH